jgi:hypothetical protein
MANSPVSLSWDRLHKPWQVQKPMLAGERQKELREKLKHENLIEKLKEPRERPKEPRERPKEPRERPKEVVIARIVNVHAV